MHVWLIAVRRASEQQRTAERPDLLRYRRDRDRRLCVIGPWTSEKFERQGGAMAHYDPHVAPPVAYDITMTFPLKLTLRPRHNDSTAADSALMVDEKMLV